MSARQTEPLPNDNDTNYITVQLDAHDSAFDIAKEVYRLSRINALLCEDLTKVRAELRTSKEKQAVMEDALSEMRAELPPTQDLLGHFWQSVEGRKVTIPHSLEVEYAALRDGDPLDIRPAFRIPRITKGTRRALRSSKVSAKQGRDEKKAAQTGKGKTTILQTHDGNAQNTEVDTPVLQSDGSEDKDERGDGGDTEVTLPTDGQTSKVAASTNVVAGKKRKAVEQGGDVAKKVKISSNSGDAVTSTARPVAGLKRKRPTETVDTALEKQEMDKTASRDTAGDDFDSDLEEGEIRV